MSTPTSAGDGLSEEEEVAAAAVMRSRCLPTYGIALTVIGVVLLDCCCDACQSPCRTYLLDVIQPEDHAAGLATFTVMAGLGGSVGYLLGGVIDWQTTGLGSSLGGHVQACHVTSLCRRGMRFIAMQSERYKGQSSPNICHAGQHI